MPDVISYQGYRFQLGQLISGASYAGVEPGSYAIWDSYSANQFQLPVAIFSPDAYGWSQAWALFASWEPTNWPVSLPGPQGMDPSLPWAQTDRILPKAASKNSKKRRMLVAQGVALSLILAAVAVVLVNGNSRIANKKVVLAAYQQTTSEKTAHVTLTGKVGISLGKASLAGNFGTGDFSGSMDFNFGNNTGSGSLSLSGITSTAQSMNIVQTPSTVYIQAPSLPLSQGKSWISTPAQTSASLASQISNCSGGNLFSSGTTQASSLSPFSSPQSVLGLLNSISSQVTDQGTQSIGGLQATRYDAKLDLNNMNCSTKAMGMTENISFDGGTIDVWIDSAGNIIQDSADLPVVVTIGNLPSSGSSANTSSGASKSMSMSMDISLTEGFSNFGEQVQVVVPPASQVETLSQMEASLNSQISTQTETYSQIPALSSSQLNQITQPMSSTGVPTT